MEPKVRNLIGTTITPGTDVFYIVDYPQKNVLMWADDGYLPLFVKCNGVGSVIQAIGIFENLKPREYDFYDIGNQNYCEGEIISPENVLLCASYASLVPKDPDANQDKIEIEMWFPAKQVQLSDQVSELLRKEIEKIAGL